MPTIPKQMWPTVERFAASLGLPASPRSDGSVAFAFENTGTLTFAATNDGERVVLTVVRPSDLPPDGVLALGGYVAAIDSLVHPGVTPSGQPALSIVYEVDDFEVSSLSTHVEVLSQRIGAR